MECKASNENDKIEIVYIAASVYTEQKESETRLEYIR